MHNCNLVLTGFMGVGKTTVGKLLAEELGRTFIETDTAIERQVGMAIVDIFAQKGEPYFRTVEQDIVRSIAFRSDLVVSIIGTILVLEACRRVIGVIMTGICLAAIYTLISVLTCPS